MKLLCTQENLNKGIKIVERVISRNTTLPILNNILFETENNKLKISATNLELGIVCWVRAKVDQQGKITVPSQIISNFVSNLPQEKIIFRADNKGKLNLKCSNYDVDIKTLPAKDFPIIPGIKKDIIAIMNIPSFWRALSQVSCAISTSQSRPEISGILLAINDKDARIVATDSYRLAEKRLKLRKVLTKKCA